MSIKGFKSQQALSQKLAGYSEDQSIDQARFVTVQEMSGRRHALDVLIHGCYQITLIPLTVAVGSNIRTIKNVGHGANKNDVIRLLDGTQFEVLSVPDANTIITSVELDVDPTGTTFTIWRHITPAYNSDGSLNVTVLPTPISYNRKSGGITLPTTVLEDLDTPANSRSMPVVIHSIDGAPINITAGDLNVQLSDQGANPDVTKIGDGTNRLGINSNLEAKTHDADLLTRANLLSTEATQLLIKAKTDNLDVALSTRNLEATQLLIKAKTDNLDVALSTRNLEATQLLIKAKTDNLDVALSTVAKASQLPTTIGQKAMAASTSIAIASDQSAIPVTMAAVPTGGATSALQTTGNTSLGNLDTNIGAKADAVATTDVGTFSLIALVKKVAQNITAMAAQLPTTLGIKTAAASLSVAPASDAKFSIKPSAITTTYAENLALTTVTTITAPANAVAVLVMADDGNANNIRIKQNATSSLTSGFPIQAGRDITFDGGQDLSVISDNAGAAGASVKIYFSWKIQA